MFARSYFAERYFAERYFAEFIEPVAGVNPICSLNVVVAVGSMGAAVGVGDLNTQARTGDLNVLFRCMGAVVAPPVPDISAPVLLLHFDGTNGSQTFTDSSSSHHAVTAHGNVQISTAQSVFGGASGYFDGVGDYLTLDGGSDFALGTGDFTVDFRIRVNAWLNFPTILNFGTGPEGTYFQLYIDSVGELGTPGGIYLWANGSDQLKSHYNPVPKLLTLAIQSHVGLTRASGITRMFIDGIQCGSPFGFLPAHYVDTNNYGSVGTTASIGADGSGALPLNAWVDELRIIKGHAAWTANFTPPAAPY